MQAVERVVHRIRILPGNIASPRIGYDVKPDMPGIDTSVITTSNRSCFARSQAIRPAGIGSGNVVLHSSIMRNCCAVSGDSPGSGLDAFLQTMDADSTGVASAERVARWLSPPRRRQAAAETTPDDAVMSQDLLDRLQRHQNRGRIGLIIAVRQITAYGSHVANANVRNYMARFSKHRMVLPY